MQECPYFSTEVKTFIWKDNGKQSCWLFVEKGEINSFFYFLMEGGGVFFKDKHDVII